MLSLRGSVAAVSLAALHCACTSAPSDPTPAGSTAGSAGSVAGSAGSATSGASGAATGASAGTMNGGAAGSAAGDSSGGSPVGSAGSAGASGGSGGAPDPAVQKFSFFLTSLASIVQVSGSDQGFGGDLRFGEQGEGAGLRGADKICKAIAEIGMPGAGAKDWRAFLSTTSGGPGGEPVHAKSRIGNGPWYDAAGRLVSMTVTDLTGSNRPGGADPAIKDDLPNEFGIPNHSADKPGCAGDCPDNHQVLTGTNCSGELFTGGSNIISDCTGVQPQNGTPNLAYTCNDWTSKEAAGEPWCGHSWPRNGSGLSWMSSAKDGGCAPCVRIEESGGPNEDCVGSAGGYGGFYCFEYKP